MSFGLQAGDYIAHFGEGIPVDIDPSGTGVIYYPISASAAPQLGDFITLPSSSFPDLNQARTYSISASVPDNGNPAMLLGFGVIGLAGLMQFRSKLRA